MEDMGQRAGHDDDGYCAADTVDQSFTLSRRAAEALSALLVVTAVC